MNWNLAAARDLPARRRWPILASLIVVAGALLVLDYLEPAVQLRPLVFILLIVGTAFGGMRFGMIFAIIAAPAFTLAEWLNVGRAVDYRLAVNALIAMVSFAFTPIIVVYIQQRIRLSTQLQAQLRQSESNQRRRAETEASRTALARAEANYRAIGESIPFGIWQTDADGNLLYVSESFRQICGMTGGQLTNGGWLERVPEKDAERFLEKWSRRDSEGDNWEGEYRLKGVDGRMYAILSRGVRLKDEHGDTIGWAGVSLDITARKRAIDAIALLEEAGRQLMLSLDANVILDRVANVCVPRFADWTSFDIVGDDGKLHNVVVKYGRPELLEESHEIRTLFLNSSAVRGVEAVARTGRSELIPLITDELLRASTRDESRIASLRTFKLDSAMIVPLIARERVIGTLTLVAGESSRGYDADDLGVAEVLGVRTALAYQNAQHYAREVRVADTLQQASLPQELPQLPGLRISATYVPGASESEIGGDWYDAFSLPDGKIGITIGDVAGKGLRAAVAMGMVRQALRGAALDGLSPAAALRRVNRHLCHERNSMVTAVAATFDPATNRLRYSFAGHPPMLLTSIAHPVTRIRTSGVPLGLFVEARYAEEERQLALGDLIVLYTDGLVEYNRNIEEGERVLAEAVAAEAFEESLNPALSIQHRVITGQPKDDVAILTLALSPHPIDRIDVQAPAVPASARVLRQALRRLTIGLGLSEEVTFPLLVAAGEAISNAIEHAYGLREGFVRLRGNCVDSRLIVEVSDEGVWRLPRDEGRGRGLPLIQSIVEQAEVVSEDSGTTVRLAVPLRTPKAK